MARTLYVTIVALLLTQTLHAQRSAYYKRVFVDAEYYFLYEEYQDALPLYLEIFNGYTENANICYRIGVCYLNISNEKHKSIPFLEKAIVNITPNYMEGYFTEVKAPKEAFYYHGVAMRIKGSFEEATASFNTYSAKLDGSEADEKLKVNKQLESIANAQLMIKKPIPVKFTSVGRAVNTRFAETNPVVSADGLTMIYTSRQQFYNAILISRYEKDEWQHPVNLNSQILADGPIQTVGISGDGNTLVLSRNDNDVFNLYTATYDPVKRNWAPMVRMPKEINSRFWENYGSLSYKGDTLYFSSNRPEGFGGFDLYYSVRGPMGWSNPVSLGGMLNTPFDEIAPVVTIDGKKLFFASKGHDTMGGYDIFVSHRLGGKWTKPQNLGYPLNSLDDDIFFFPIGNGSMEFMSRNMQGNFGREDIYWVQLEPPQPDGDAFSSSHISSKTMQN